MGDAIDDVDVVAHKRSARRRRIGGVTMLASAVVSGLAFWLLSRHPTDLVYLEMHRDPLVAWAISLAFLAGSVPLLVPQLNPPTDPRRKRWFVALALWVSVLQLVCVGFEREKIDTLAVWADGERAVVVYRPDTPYACMAVWIDQSPVTRIAGTIGRPDSFYSVDFRDRDTVLLGGSSRDWVRTIRLDPKSGRPLDHTEPCRTAGKKASSQAAPPVFKAGDGR
jgi:hypothetical protein